MQITDSHGNKKTQGTVETNEVTFSSIIDTGGWHIYDLYVCVIWRESGGAHKSCRYESTVKSVLTGRLMMQHIKPNSNTPLNQGDEKDCSSTHPNQTKRNDLALNQTERTRNWRETEDTEHFTPSLPQFSTCLLGGGTSRGINCSLAIPRQ